MNALIVVAGGSGRRMGGAVPKQYLELKGKALILHTLERFFLFDPGIKTVVVLAGHHQKFWDEIVSSSEAAMASQVVIGGENRYDSVWNGLKQVPDGKIVGIHDAVRPLVSLDTIERSYSAARESGSGIPVIDMDESVRILTPGGSENLERSKLRKVQTPQVFRSEEIRAAYENGFPPSVTDDASVYEAFYGKLTLVNGNPENIKITNSADLKLASLII